MQSSNTPATLVNARFFEPVLKAWTDQRIDVQLIVTITPQIGLTSF